MLFPVYIPMLPGSTLHIRVQLLLGVTVTAGSAGTVKRPWALFGRKPWVESLCFPKMLKSVNIGMPLRAEPSALPGENG